MLSCRETARLLSEATDEPQPLRRRIGLRFHLMMCRLCRRYAKQIGLLDEAARSLSRRVEEGDEAAPGGLAPEAKARMRSALDDGASS